MRGDKTQEAILFLWQALQESPLSIREIYAKTPVRLKQTLYGLVSAARVNGRLFFTDKPNTLKDLIEWVKRPPRSKQSIRLPEKLELGWSEFDQLLRTVVGRYKGLKRITMKTLRDETRKSNRLQVLSDANKELARQLQAKTDQMEAAVARYNRIYPIWDQIENMVLDQMTCPDSDAELGTGPALEVVPDPKPIQLNRFHGIDSPICTLDDHRLALKIAKTIPKKIRMSFGRLPGEVDKDQIYSVCKAMGFVVRREGSQRKGPHHLILDPRSGKSCKLSLSPSKIDKKILMGKLHFAGVPLVQFTARYIAKDYCSEDAAANASV